MAQAANASLTFKFKNAVALGVELGQKSSAFSDEVAAIERLFQSLPGKIEVSKSGGSSSLKFCKVGREWRLIYCTTANESGSPLVDCSLEHKIKSIGLIGDLVDQYIAAAQRKIGDVDQAREVVSAAVAELAKLKLK